VQRNAGIFFELFTAIRLLEIEGLISLEYSTSPGVPVVYPRSTIRAELRQAGLICAEEYDGDIWKMREAQKHGDDNRVYVRSAAKIAVHSSDITQSSDRVLNISAEVREIRKIAEFAIVHTGELGLSAKDTLEIGNIIGEADIISLDPKPDSSKAGELAHSLRKVPEDAVGNILAEIILKHSGL
jgi:hypothetical protein